MATMAAVMAMAITITTPRSITAPVGAMGIGPIVGTTMGIATIAIITGATRLGIGAAGTNDA